MKRDGYIYIFFDYFLFFLLLLFSFVLSPTVARYLSVLFTLISDVIGGVSASLIKSTSKHYPSVSF